VNTHAEHGTVTCIWLSSEPWVTENHTHVYTGTVSQACL